MNVWSLVLDLRGSPDETLAQAAVVRFLAGGPGAPTQWLKPGSGLSTRVGTARRRARRAAQVVVHELSDKVGVAMGCRELRKIG